MLFSPPYLVEIIEIFDLYVRNYCTRSSIFPHVMQSFTSSELLINHITKCHYLNDMNFKNMCQKCLKIFSSVHTLRRHSKSINCLKPLPKEKCEKCNTIFANPSNLRRHIKSKHETNSK